MICSKCGWDYCKSWKEDEVTHYKCLHCGNVWYGVWKFTKTLLSERGAE